MTEAHERQPMFKSNIAILAGAIVVVHGILYVLFLYPWPFGSGSDDQATDESAIVEESEAPVIEIQPTMTDTLGQILADLKTIKADAAEAKRLAGLAYFTDDDRAMLQGVNRSSATTAKNVDRLATAMGEQTKVLGEVKTIATRGTNAAEYGRDYALGAHDAAREAVTIGKESAAKLDNIEKCLAELRQGATRAAQVSATEMDGRGLFRKARPTNGALAAQAFLGALEPAAPDSAVVDSTIAPPATN